MRPVRRMWIVGLLLLAGGSCAGAQEKVSPKAQQLAEALQALLPEYERAADGFEQALQALPGDAKTAVAADGARLQVEAIRSVRRGSAAGNTAARASA